MTSRARTRLVAVAGNLFVAAALVAAVVAVRRDLDAVREAVRTARAPLIAAGFAVAVLSVGLLARCWSAALATLGARRPTAEVVRWFAVGQVGKYVPGGIWHVVGQGELSRRGGVPARSAYGSVALSNLALVGSAALAVVAGRALGIIDGPPWWVAATGAAVLGIAALAPVRRRAATALRLPEGDGALRLVSLLRVAAAASPAWAAIGTTTWLVAAAYGAEAGAATVVVAAIASWLVGIVTLPAPGGIGVREAAFVALIAPSAGSSTATLIAITARLVFVVADLACWTAGRVSISAAARRAASSTAAG